MSIHAQDKRPQGNVQSTIAFEQIFSWDDSGIKEGKTFLEIAAEMKKASTERLLKEPVDEAFS
jgi:hypothetical protein